MEFRKATKEYAEEIYQLVQNTIRQVYPRYYPEKVVEFFCEHHNPGNIMDDIEHGHVYVLVENQRLLGTGSRKADHITRVFVSPEYQGRGYGSYIIQKLEDEIALYYRTVNLDASLPASGLYESRGYQTVKHEKLAVGSEAVLVYEIMEKELL